MGLINILKLHFQFSDDKNISEKYQLSKFRESNPALLIEKHDCFLILKACPVQSKTRRNLKCDIRKYDADLSLASKVDIEVQRSSFIIALAMTT